MSTPPPTHNQTQASEDKNNTLLACIIQSSDDAIISKDLNGIITSWNKGAENMFGFTSREMIGAPIQQLLLADRLNEENLILKRVAKGDKVSHFKTAWKCKDGKVIQISITISPVLENSGKLIGVSQIARDITKQIKIERDLYEQVIANKELAFQNEEKAKRAAELVIANKELAFQNEEKAKRAAELVIANKELAFQNEEKAKRAAELVIANKELAFQNEEKAKRAAELLVITERLKVSLLETVNLAARIGEMRDAYTAGHEKSVGRLSEAIATELGFDKEFQEGIRIAGHLHDIGKIIVPIEILVKPTKLTIKEFELVKEHVDAGYRLLNDISFPWPVANLILEHHERLDGSGYPKGLKGDEISMGGRIMAVADVVDAMSTHRPYRPGLGVDSALAELKRGYGILYDKTVVDACINLIEDKGFKVKETLFI
jgi:PAS domain S-box-containing protein/putative nucleotidyltransferase with HDIG domain